MSGNGLTVTVLGTPAPQGSKRHVGNGVMVESSAKVKPWREAVKWALLDPRAVAVAMPPDVPPWHPDHPVRVELVFTLAKPASAPKRRRTWPSKRPDLDKIIRATLDAIVDSGTIRDDGQVVELIAAKRYPGEGEHALASPGAWIRITEVTDAVPWVHPGVRQEWAEVDE